MAAAAILKIRKIALSPQWNEQFWRSLVQWRVWTLPILTGNKNSRFWKYKMVAAAILKSQKILISLQPIDRFWQNLASWCIFDFWNRKILSVIIVHSLETHQRAKFRRNRSIGCKGIKIFPFFKMAAVRHLGLFWGIFGPLTVNTYGSLSLCKISLWSMQQFFYNMNISIFDTFGWKMPIHAPKIGVLGQFDTQNGVQYQRKPKKMHILAWVRVI